MVVSRRGEVVSRDHRTAGAYVQSSVLPWRGFAPGPFPEVLIPEASKSVFPWVIARSPSSIG